MSLRVRSRLPAVTARRHAGGRRGIRLSCYGLCLAAVYGCNAHTGPPSQTPQAPPTPVAPQQSTAPPPKLPTRIQLDLTIDGVAHRATGLLTTEGAVRLRVGGGAGGAALLQLVGDGVQTAGYVAGSGTIYGEACAASPPARFCDQPSPAEFELPTQFDAVATIWVTTAGHREAWTGRSPSYSVVYALPSAQPWDSVKGLYSMRGTELVGSTGTVLTIDGQGRLFFQSSETGCTGNGTMSLRSNSDTDLYDASLTIESCAGAYGYLNDRFEGLSIMDNDAGCSGCWDDGVGLLNTPKFWLSTPAGVAALSFFADPVD